MLTSSPSRGSEGIERNKHVQTPWGRGGQERNLWPFNLGAHAGLELWQVKSQDRTEPRSPSPIQGWGNAQREPGHSARSQRQRNLCL